MPPEDTKPACYWYWMNEHISKEGVTRDLEGMTRVGIGEAFIGNIFEGGEHGPVKTLSKEWLEIMQHAIKEGSRLGVKISMFNSPGWSQSGGPWIEGSESMRFIVYSEKDIVGGKKIKVEIPKPDFTPFKQEAFSSNISLEDRKQHDKKYFQDVALIAYPINDEKKIEISSYSSLPASNEISNLFDGTGSYVIFGNEDKESVVLDLGLKNEETISSVTISPTGLRFGTTIEFFVKENEEYKSVKKIYFDRINGSPQLGPRPDGDMVFSIPEIKGKDFRISLSDIPANFELCGVKLHSIPRLERVTEKSLCKMPNTPSPSFDQYHWMSQEDIADRKFISSENCINISEYLNGDILEWTPPAGNWRIVRFGMSPTGTKNTPAAPSASGLEIDKLSTKSVQKLYDSFVGHIIKDLSDEEKKSLSRIVADSYEVGPQNWTDKFAEEFEKRMNYDPIPFLPVMTGQIIGSIEQSDRFLWDMRKVASDMIADYYVGGWKEVSNKNGMKIWLENYGHWGFQGEFLSYAAKTDDVGGEFWSNWSDGQECKMASSAANIYGKNKVFAESYTAGGNSFGWYPGGIKHRGDWSYTEGINQVVLHVYIHQPYKDKYPGVNAWFGIEYNHHNTWFNASKPWIDYQRRCCYMLQQGLPVRDVCFFIGEDAPQMHGWKDPSLSKGYSYDYINADVIINHLTVNNGKLVLPSGQEYSVLSLAPLKTMRPHLLKRIIELVEQGATIVGLPPVKAPGLTNFPYCDQEIKNLSDKLWGMDYDSKTPLNKTLGKGRIIANIPINEVLKSIKINKDVEFDETLPLLWTHRTIENGEIYFICNQNDSRFNTNVSFRTNGYIPELWDAVTGTKRELNSFSCDDNTTIIPLSFDNKQSYFIVFREPGDAKGRNMIVEENFRPDSRIIEFKNSWNIELSNEWLDQKYTLKSDSLFDWSKSEDEKIKYFSGDATYNNTISIPKIAKNERCIIKFDHVFVMGSVKVNGKDAGALWTPPYELDITDLVKKGKNQISMSVSNLWINQLIKQDAVEDEEKNTWCMLKVVDKSQNLQPSGIFGNARVVIR